MSHSVVFWSKTAFIAVKTGDYKMIASWVLHITCCLKIHGGSCEMGAGLEALQNAAHFAKLWAKKFSSPGTYTICPL